MSEEKEDEAAAEAASGKKTFSIADNVSKEYINHVRNFLSCQEGKDKIHTRHSKSMEVIVDKENDQKSGFLKSFYDTKSKKKIKYSSIKGQLSDL